MGWMLRSKGAQMGGLRLDDGRAAMVDWGLHQADSGVCVWVCKCMVLPPWQPAATPQEHPHPPNVRKRTGRKNNLPPSSATPRPWEPPRPWQPVSPGSGPVLEEPQGQRLPRMVENSPWAADKALIAAS